MTGDHTAKQLLSYLVTQVDSTHYPNWTTMITTLGSRGIRTLTYINSMLSDVSLRGTPYHHNYYAEAVQNGYLVRNADGSIWSGYSNSSMVDLSNAEAYQWMVNIIVKVNFSWLPCVILLLITNLIW